MWSYEGDPTDEDVHVEKTLRRFLNHGEVSRGFSRFWSLYRYLVINPPTNPLTLRKTVFVDRAGSIPFFDEPTSKKVVHMWKIVHNPTHFSRYLSERFKRAKKGGAAETKNTETLDQAIDYVVKKADETAVNIGLTPENPSVLGKVATVGSYARWALALPTRILPWIESNPYLGGPLWEIAIELFLKLVPKLILVLDTVVPILSIPLMPVFGLGFVIEAFAFAIATFLSLVTVFLALATGKIGSAFLNFLQLIPFVGPFLRLGVVNIVDSYNSVEEELPKLGRLPIIGPLIYKEPTIEQQNGGRRTRRRRRTHKQSKSVGSTRR